MDESTRTQEQIRRLASGESLPRDPELEHALADYSLEYQIRSDTVALREPLELLDHDSIAGQLSPEAARMSGGIKILWSVDSTNTWMLQNDKREDWHGLVCLAEQQLAGKGRRGRRWASPFGKNIYMSIGWGIPRNISGLSGLSLLVGMQVIRALKSLGLKDTWLKWPNDIIMGQGKLAGILVELTAPSQTRVGVVTGIGVNLRLDAGDAVDIDQGWSTIGEQQEVSRNTLTALILSELLPALSRFETEGFAPWQQAWDDFDLFRHQAVTVHMGENKISGLNKGIDGDGNLLIETDKGVETFSAGEVSLREA
ncbi:MAG: biotin--[acetyl-CoA-carboxylase] ligase [Pseudomonadales bacterium]